MTSSIEVRQATPEMAESWDRFVARIAGGSVCHLFGWRRVVERTYGHRCLYLHAGEADDLLGALPLVLIKPPLAKASLVSMPFLDQGGALGRTPEVTDALHGAARDLARRLNAKRIELRGGDFERLQPDELQPQRFRLILPLPDASEALWKSIGPKVRNQVRKAEKSQLSTRQVGAERLADFYDVFADSMRNLGSPVHSRRLFEELFREFDQRARLYLTFLEETRVVAGGIALSFNDETVVPWAASLRSERKRCPNHSLYWRILSDAVERREAAFDFGRSWAGSGTFHFKKQWGAEPHPLRWLSLDRHGEPNRGANLKPQDHRLLTDTWSRLPLPVSTWLGSRIRGYLAN